MPSTLCDPIGVIMVKKRMEIFWEIMEKIQTVSAEK